MNFFQRKVGSYLISQACCFLARQLFILIILFFGNEESEKRMKEKRERTGEEGPERYFIVFSPFPLQELRNATMLQ